MKPCCFCKAARILPLPLQLQPDSIALDPEEIGRIDTVAPDVRKREIKLAKEAGQEGKEDTKIKRKMKGRGGTAARASRKQTNVITEQRVRGSADLWSMALLDCLVCRKKSGKKM